MGVVGPQIGVECVVVIVAVRAAAPSVAHQAQHDDLVVALDHREDRRVLEEIANNPETELVPIILGGSNHIAYKKEWGDPRHARHD